MKFCIYVASSLMLLSVPALAQNGEGKLTQQDRTFAKEAAQGNLAEIQVGQYAAQHAESPAARLFGLWLETDHKFANQMLAGVAQRDNMQLPTTPNQQQMQMFDQLRKLSGPQFDERLAADMVQDHEKDIQKFRTEAKDGHGRMKMLAASLVPVLQAHLQAAQDLRRDVQGRAQASGTGTQGATGAGTTGTVGAGPANGGSASGTAKP